MPISELRFSVRASNCLEYADIRTVRDLVQRNEDQLMEIRNFGETTLVEVTELLSQLGSALGHESSTGSDHQLVENQPIAILVQS